jgi:hypothetical protein
LGRTSTAQPVKCALVLDPFTALFNKGHLYPELTIIALPQDSLSGSNICSTKYFKFALTSAVGVLLIFNLSAVSD